MILTKERIRLFFTFYSEYSLDGGVSWIQLPAYTELFIDNADVTADRIIVQTDSPDATELDPNELEFSFRRFDAINIRNGSILENADALFSGSQIGDLRIANTPLIASADNFATYSDIGTVSSIDMPICKNFELGFKESNIGKIGNINLPTTGKIKELFLGSKVGVIGNVNIGESISRSNLNTSYGLFKDATIEVFPNLNIHSNVYVDGADDTTFDWFSNLDSKYMLSQDIKLFGDDLLSHKSVYGDGFVSGSSLQFAGINVIEGQSSADYKFAQDDVNANIFTKILKFQNVLEENVPVTFDANKPDSKVNLESQGRFLYMIEDKWLKDLSVIETFTMTNYADFHGLKGDSTPYRIMYTNSNHTAVASFVPIKAASLKDIEWKVDEANYVYSNARLLDFFALEPQGLIISYGLSSPMYSKFIKELGGSLFSYDNINDGRDVDSAHFCQTDDTDYDSAMILFTRSTSPNTICQFYRDNSGNTTNVEKQLSNVPVGFVAKEVYKPHFSTSSLLLVLFQNDTTDETYACTYVDFDSLDDYNDYTSKIEFSGANRPTRIVRGMGEPNEVMLTNKTNGFTSRVLIGVLFPES